MNKEKITQEEVNKIILSKWTKEELAEQWINEHIRCNELQQENKQLKDKLEKYKKYGEAVGEKRNELYERIDKAIEYFELEEKEGTLWSVNSTDKLLEILKGDNNE